MLALFGVTWDGATAQRPIEDTIDSLVQAEMDARPIAGMQVAVVQREDTLFWRGWGSADLEHRVPMERSSVFQIASVTKQFTAAAVLRLVEDGRIGLDDDIRTHLPELDTGDHVVRLRQMLNHTSGLPDIYSMTSWPEIRPLRLLRPEARKLEIAGVAEDSLDFAPGTDFRYSNTGYDLLGDMIEEVTGHDVETFFTEELFEPLGLESTSFCPWTRIVPHRVRGYEPDSTGTSLGNARRQAQGVLHTSGGICSTAGDLLRWNRGLHHGEVLNPSSYNAMTTPHGAASSYGFGLYVRDVRGHPKLEHNGYTPGFSSQLDHWPDDSLTVVVLANSPAAVGALADDIARAVLGLPPAPVAVRPEGWRVRAVDAGADTAAIDFRTMGGGVHITGGPSALYFHPDSVAGGEYKVEATFFALADPGPDGGHGLLLAGREVDAHRGSYLAFVVRRGEEYALIRHRADAMDMLVPWTADPAVGSEGGTATLEVSVSEDALGLIVNGTEVKRLSPDVGADGIEGVFGIWAGAGDDVHVDGLHAEIR